MPSMTGEKENREKSFRLLICISIVQQVTSTSACLTGKIFKIVEYIVCKSYMYVMQVKKGKSLLCNG